MLLLLEFKFYTAAIAVTGIQIKSTNILQLMLLSLEFNYSPPTFYSWHCCHCNSNSTVDVVINGTEFQSTFYRWCCWNWSPNLCYQTDISTFSHQFRCSWYCLEMSPEKLRSNMETASEADEAFSSQHLPVLHHSTGHSHTIHGDGEGVARVIRTADIPFLIKTSFCSSQRISKYLYTAHIRTATVHRRTATVQIITQFKLEHNYCYTVHFHIRTELPLEQLHCSYLNSWKYLVLFMLSIFQLF